jgi:phage head maturation protease
MTIRAPSNPTTTRALSVRSASFDEAENTVEVVYATATRAQRDGYLEELVISEEAIDATRLDAGAVPLLVDHMPWGTAFGTVVGHRIEGGQAIATVKLSVAEEHRGIVENIKAGVIRTVSVGYQILGWDEVPTEDGAPVMRVTRWMPAEISLVTIPADHLAQIRSTSSADLVRRTITAAPKKEASMTVKTKAKTGQRSAAAAAAEVLDEVAEAAGVEATQELEAAVEEAIQGAVDTVAEEAAAESEETAADETAAEDDGETVDEAPAEASRAAAILELCTRHGLSLAFATRHVKAGTSIHQVRAAVLDSIAARSAPPMTTARITRDERETLVSRASDAIYSRMSGEAPTAQARDMRYLSVVEMARAFVGADAAGMSRSQVVQAALQTRSGMHTTSDFAAALGNAASRTLRRAYEAATPTYGPFVREVTLPDFRATDRVQIGDAPILERRAEGSETKRGTLSDSKESIQLATFAKALSMSRQMMVNDDLDAFSRILTSFGMRAAELQSDLVYGKLTGNPKMSDGKSLFHASHNNILNVALDVNGLSEARKAMRKQTGLDGAKLNISPVTLIVGPELETEAQKIIAPISAALAGDVNPFAGSSLQLVVDSRIEDAAWFLAANPALIDTIELAFLDGARGVQTSTIDAPMLDGVDVLAQIDCEAGVIDFRGLLKSAGGQ